MRLAIVADVYAPLRSSGAVQLRDLSREMVRLGYDVTVMTAVADLGEPYRIETSDGIRVIRLSCLRTRDTNYLRRTFAEFLMPFVMLRNLRKSEAFDDRYDGVIWYSPTIFLGPLASFLKRKSECRAYLIVRDIFPEWAADMGLMSRGIAFQILRKVASYQYRVADVIGVQTPGNLKFLDPWRAPGRRRIEVLQNWLTHKVHSTCQIDLSTSAVAGRMLFIYAGNMGVAQGLDIMLDVADKLREHRDIGFVFVGRGSDAARLQAQSIKRGLDNIVFFDEIDPDEVPALYAQCAAGLVVLDPRHSTHNIPGKFLSYMHAGLPVLAAVNAGNDLIATIQMHRVGRACSSENAEIIVQTMIDLVGDLRADAGMPKRCFDLAQREFSSQSAVEQIVAALDMSEHAKRTPGD
jgi:glycosyltransferase involved in cell wall biosynthesis